MDDKRHTARASFAGLALSGPDLVALLQRRTGGSLDEDEVESALAQLDIPHTPGAITIENGSIVLLLEVDPAASRVAAVARAKQQVDTLLARIRPTPTRWPPSRRSASDRATTGGPTRRRARSCAA